MRTNENMGKVKRTCIDLVRTNTGFVQVDSAHQRKSWWYCCRNHSSIFDYQMFLNSIKPILLEKLTELALNHPIKFNFKLEAKNNIPNVEN